MPLTVYAPYAVVVPPLLILLLMVYSAYFENAPSPIWWDSSNPPTMIPACCDILDRVGGIQFFCLQIYGADERM